MNAQLKAVDHEAFSASRSTASTSSTVEKNWSLVSLVIPCSNEQNHIAKCLDSIYANDYPKDRVEILVVDGASTDRTREILEEYQRRWPQIRLIENPRKLIPI